MSCAHTTHMPLFLLLFCPCLCWIPCLVLYPSYQLKIGSITGIYLIWWKKSSQQYQLPYYPILFPIWKNYLTIDNHTPPNHKIVKIYGTFSRATSKSKHEITPNPCWFLTVHSKLPATLTMWSSMPTSMISPSTNCAQHQNYVMHNNTYNSFWSRVIEETLDVKNDHGAYTENAFHKVCNNSFTFVASYRCHIAAVNCLLYYMHDGKKIYNHMSPKHFLTHF